MFSVCSKLVQRWGNPFWAAILGLAVFGSPGFVFAVEEGDQTGKESYTLNDCLDLALRQNPDIEVARKRIEESAGVVIHARSGFLPRVTTSGEYKYLESDFAELSGAAPNRRNDIWTVAIRLTQNLYRGGGDKGRIRIAHLQRESRMHEYQATVDRVLLDVRIAFYDVLRNRGAIAVHRQAIAFLEKQLEHEKERLELGTGQQLHVLRADVNLSLERASLIEAENRLRNSYLRLGELLAIPQEVPDGPPPFQIEGTLKHVKPDYRLNDCMNRALALRPEIKIRENEVQAQQRQVEVDRSDILPQLDLFAEYEFINEPNRKLSKEYYDGYVVGVQVRWQIFDGLSAHGRMQASRARSRAAGVSLEAIIRTVESEVLRSFHDMQQAEKVIESQHKNVEYAREALELARTTFEQGSSSQLDLLQSQLDFSRAQLVEVNALYEYNVALARLERAISSRIRFVDESNPEATE